MNKDKTHNFMKFQNTRNKNHSKEGEQNRSHTKAQESVST